MTPVWCNCPASLSQREKTRAGELARSVRACDRANDLIIRP